MDAIKPRRLTAFFTACLLGLSFVFFPSRAQAAAPTLSILDQPPVVYLDQPFQIGLSLNRAGAGPFSVEAELYSPAGSRSYLDSLLSGNEPSRPISSETLASSQVSVFSSGSGTVLEVRLQLNGSSGAGLLTGCSSDCYGNYPLELRVEAPGLQASVLTVLTLLNSPQVASPLYVALLYNPVLSPQALAGKGGLLALKELIGELPPQGLIQKGEVFLAPEMGALLVAGSLEQRGSEQFLSRLASLPWAGMLTEPLVDLPAPASPSGSLLDLLGQDLSLGRQYEESYFKLSPLPCTLTHYPLSDAVAQVLLKAGVECVIGPPQIFRPSFLNKTATAPFYVSVGQAGRLTAASLDPALSDSTGASSVSTVLLNLSQVYFDAPNAPQPRGVVLEVSSDNTAMLGPLIAAISSAPELQLVSLSELLSRIEPGFNDNPASRSLAEAPRQAALRQPLNSQTPQVMGLAEMSPSSPVAQLAVSAFFEELDPSVSAAVREALSRYVLKDLFLAQNCLKVSAPSTVTLTSQRGRIPVSLSLCPAMPAAEVTLRLESDSIRFPQGALRQLLLSATPVTAYFAIKPRGNGSYPMDVKVLAPNGVVLKSFRIMVRYEPFSLLAALLTAGSVALLALWWIRTALRRTTRRMRGKHLRRDSSPAPNGSIGQRDPLIKG